jgi:hypothetical protein
MTSGRTSPAVFGCVREGYDEEDDYVVKLAGGSETGLAGLLCEAVAAELADYFGIDHPQQALVELNGDLANLVASQEHNKAALMAQSVGVNFGTKLLTNMITWPVDRKLSASQFERACEIFAFDALTQNPDRRFSNPNLGTVGDQIYVFDHELAFSFRLDIFPNREPWRIISQPFWAEHVFFNALRHKPLALDGFTELLANLPQLLFDQLEEVLPPEWPLDLLPVIRNHLTSVSAHAEEFKEELTGTLL